MIPVACDLCGADEPSLIFIKEGFRHVRCRKCGLVYVNPRQAKHLDLQKISGTGSMGEDKLTQSQRRRLQKELKSMEPFRRLNRILEIGAGRGWFIREAADAGWETLAVEVNADALSFLRKTTATRIMTTPAEELTVQEESVDVVRIWDVIEHLESPRRALERISHALRRGGLLRLSTTNFASLSRRVNGPEWVYINGSDHIILFEPATIMRLLLDQGFSQIKIRTRSFNLRRKLYHPEQDLPLTPGPLRLFRKIVDEAVRFTSYGHQMIVTACKS